jgi:hypothetical protein
MRLRGLTGRAITAHTSVSFNQASVTLSCLTHDAPLGSLSETQFKASVTAIHAAIRARPPPLPLAGVLAAFKQHQERGVLQMNAQPVGSHLRICSVTCLGIAVVAGPRAFAADAATACGRQWSTPVAWSAWW